MSSGEIEKEEFLLNRKSLRQQAAAISIHGEITSRLTDALGFQVIAGTAGSLCLITSKMSD